MTVNTCAGSSYRFVKSFFFFCESIFSDNQGNGTVSKASMSWPLPGSGRAVTRRVSLSLTHKHTHVEVVPFYLPDAECLCPPFLPPHPPTLLHILFFLILLSGPLDLLTYAKQTNHQETHKKRREKKRTESVINSDLDWRATRKTKPMHWQKRRERGGQAGWVGWWVMAAKKKRKKMASDNEETLNRWLSHTQPLPLCAELHT